MIQGNLLKILFVEDLPSDVDLAVLELRKEKIQFEYQTVCTRKDLLDALRDFNPDLIISDYMMPSFNGLQALKITKEYNINIPFILFTGSVNEETAVECIKAGAQDYVIKEHLTRLPFSVRETLEQVRINSEKKVSESLLKVNEEKLQSIFIAAPVGIGLVINRILVEVNDALCTMLGYRRDELVGNSAEIMYISEEEFITVGKDKYKQIAELGTGSVETIFKTKDGTLLNVLLSSTPLDKKDYLKGVTFTVLNITERKRSEEALKKSEEKYRRIFDNVQDVYYETSISGNIIEVSPSIETLCKCTTGDLIGKSIYDFYVDPRVRQIMMKELDEKSFVTDFEVNFRNYAGSDIPCSVSAKLLFDQNGVPEKIIGSMHDITDRKNASNALILAKEKAETSDRLKTEFLNNISHEVRTPLNGILGFAEIISLHDLSDTERKESLSMLFESSNRLLNTITNYMDISLITSGSLSINKKDFSPAVLLEKIYNVFESLCTNKGLKLTMEISPQSNNYLINSDQEICRKIISHFLDNAVKFTETGSIHFGFRQRNQQLEFFVKDTGIGIGNDSFSTIFDRFVKENHGPFRVSEGSGLGLSIARGMAEAIGAKIKMESELEVGSSFYLLIPVEEEIRTAPLPAADNNSSVKIETEAPILVAEDDETNFYYLNALLGKESNVKILHAINGREAIEIFKANRDIKLILMDMKMPEIDGFEATRQIKMIDSNVHIIAITAYAMSGDEERVLASGCDDYLSKPINKKSLFEKIAAYIEA